MNALKEELSIAQGFSVYRNASFKISAKDASFSFRDKNCFDQKSVSRAKRKCMKGVTTSYDQTRSLSLT
jgi:hypothetical protein